MKRIFLGISILFLTVTASLFCGVANADMGIFATLEWLTDTSPSVGIYTVKIVETDAPGQVVIDAVLNTSLRGNLPKSFSFKYSTLDIEYNEAGSAPKGGDEFLVFLGDPKTHYIFSEYVINLTSPSHDPRRGAIRPDFSILTSGIAIEKVVRDLIAKRQLTVTPNEWSQFSIEIPPGTPGFEPLCRKDVCGLLVPSDFQRKTPTKQGSESEKRN
ncbi:MAG: hypothetical protein HZB36_08475 [Candidatus Omnitrophica bacterium]|nr:hypothetical protein [Candidatus Omnitrophota bacterium]